MIRTEKGAGHTAVQFRYLFACDAAGLKVVDITDVAKPAVRAAVPLAGARDIYIARTYAVHRRRTQSDSPSWTSNAPNIPPRPSSATS